MTVNDLSSYNAAYHVSLFHAIDYTYKKPMKVRTIMVINL